MATTRKVALVYPLIHSWASFNATTVVGPSCGPRRSRMQTVASAASGCRRRRVPWERQRALVAAPEHRGRFRRGPSNLPLLSPPPSLSATSPPLPGTPPPEPPSWAALPPPTTPPPPPPPAGEQPQSPGASPPVPPHIPPPRRPAAQGTNPPAARASPPAVPRRRTLPPSPIQPSPLQELQESAPAPPAGRPLLEADPGPQERDRAPEPPEPPAPRHPSR